MLDILVAILTFSLTGIVAFTLLQNRILIKQNHILAVRERIVELVGSVVDPIIQQLEDIRHTVQNRNFLWSTNDEAVAVKELPKGELYQFQVNDRFYYPTPRLEILRPLFAGASLLFQKERFADFEEAKPEIMAEINQLQDKLQTLGATLRSIAIAIIRFLNSEKPNLFPDTACVPYLGHITLAKLIMEPNEFESFLDTFARNQELLQAKELWIEKREAILSRVGNVHRIQQVADEFKSLCSKLTDQIAGLLNRFNDLRREYLRTYHIPVYLVDAHKERRLQALRWKNEVAKFNA